MNDEWKNVRVKLDNKVIDTVDLEYEQSEFGFMKTEWAKETYEHYPFIAPEFDCTFNKIRKMFKQELHQRLYLEAVCRYSLKHVLGLTEGYEQCVDRFGTKIPDELGEFARAKEDLKREITKALKIPQFLRWLGKYIK